MVELHKDGYALKFLFPQGFSTSTLLRHQLITEFFNRGPHPIYWDFDLDDVVGLAHKCTGRLTLCTFTSTSERGRHILAQGKGIPWSGVISPIIHTESPSGRSIILGVGLIPWEERVV